MPEECDAHENVQWVPFVPDGDLVMYLRAARSMAAFAGMCDGGSADDGCIAACRDDTTLNAMDTLHNSNYDTGRALQALVKNPVPRGIEKKWTDDEQKRFVKGLRQYGKNFFKIRKELLPQKETSELVEFYYLWKKTPAAVSNRPHRRHRRQAILRKIRGGARSNRVQSTDFGADASSASEEENESDDSDSRDVSGCYCHHCSTTTSKEWHPVGKDRTILCSECCVLYKNGELRPLPDEPSSFLFKPVKEDENSQGETKQGVRTRRTKDAAETKVGNNFSSSRTATPEIADSPVSTNVIGVQMGKGRKSPSTWSTCSTSSTDRLDTGNKKTEMDICQPTRKRGNDEQNLELEAECENKPKKVKTEICLESPTESVMSESGSLSNEENGHDGDNEQDGLSFPSSPSVRSPSPVDADSIKGKIPTNSTSVPPPAPLPPVSELPPVQISNPASPVVDQQIQQPSQPLIKCSLSPPQMQPVAPPPLISSPCPSTPVGIKTEMQTIVKQEVILAEEQPLRNTLPCRSPSPVPVAPTLAAISTSDQSKLQEESLDLVARRSPYPTINPSAASPIMQMSHPCSPSPAHQQPTHSSISMNQPQRIPSPMSYNKHLAIIPGMPHCPPSLSPQSLHSYPHPLPHQLGMHQPSQFVSPGRFNPMEPPPPAHSLPHQHLSPYSQMRPVMPELQISPSARSPSGRLSPMISPPFTSAVHSSRRSGLVQPLTLPPEHVEYEVEDEEEAVGPSRPPSPDPRVDDSECIRTVSAIFLRHWNRGEFNSCCRTDIAFKPAPDSKLARKREERLRKQAEKDREERERAEAKTMCTPEIKNSTEAKNGQHSVGMESPMRHASPYERCTPRGYGAHDTPALRQLSEYARPHTAFSPNMPRSIPPGMSVPSHGIDPMIHYQLSAGIYPPGARERIEYEFEREKLREQEFREREMRERMLHDKLKELEMKPALARLPPGAAGPLESHWLDMHRRYVTMPGNQVVPGMPGPFAIYAHGAQMPGGILDRDRMERMGLAPHVAPSDGTYSGSVERLSAERLHAERMALTADPMLRFQMASMAPPGHMMAPGPGVPQQGTIDGHQLLQQAVYPRPGLHPRDAATLLHPSAAASLLNRQYEDQLAHQLTAHAHEQLQRQMMMERERYPPPGAQLHPTLMAQHEEYLRQQQQQRDREMKIRTLEEAARGGRPYDHIPPGEKR